MCLEPNPDPLEEHWDLHPNPNPLEEHWDLSLQLQRWLVLMSISMSQLRITWIGTLPWRIILIVLVDVDELPLSYLALFLPLSSFMLLLIPSLISQQGLQVSSWTKDDSAPGSCQDLGTGLVLLSPVDWETTEFHFLQWGTLIGAPPIAEALSLNDRTANKFLVSQVWFCCCYCFKKSWIN